MLVSQEGTVSRAAGKIVGRSSALLLALTLAACGGDEEKIKSSTKADKNAKPDSGLLVSEELLKTDPVLEDEVKLPKEPIESELAKAEKGPEPKPVPTLREKIKLSLSSSFLKYDKEHGTIDKWIAITKSIVPEGSIIIPGLKKNLLRSAISDLDIGRESHIAWVSIGATLRHVEHESVDVLLPHQVSNQVKLTDTNDQEVNLAHNIFEIAPDTCALAGILLQDRERGLEIAEIAKLSEKQIKALDHLGTQIKQIAEKLKGKLGTDTLGLTEFGMLTHSLLVGSGFDKHGPYFYSKEFLALAGIQVFKSLEYGDTTIEYRFSASLSDDLVKKHIEASKFIDDIALIFRAGPVTKEDLRKQTWEIYQKYKLVPKDWSFEEKSEKILKALFSTIPITYHIGLSHTYMYPSGKGKLTEAQAKDVEAIKGMHEKAQEALNTNFAGKTVVFEDLEKFLIAFAASEIPAQQRSTLFNPLVKKVVPKFSRFSEGLIREKGVRAVIYPWSLWGGEEILQNTNVSWTGGTDDNIRSLASRDHHIRGYYLDTVFSAIKLSMMNLKTPNRERGPEESAYKNVMKIIDPFATELRSLLDSKEAPNKRTPGSVERVLWEGFKSSGALEGTFEGKNWTVVRTLADKIHDYYGY